MEHLKDWSEFLKDVPTEVLHAEIESRKSRKNDSISPGAIDIMNRIDNAIEKFGSYTFDDKGAFEVMSIYSIKKELAGKPTEEIAGILSEVLDKYSNKYRAEETVSCIISSLDDMPEEEFDRLLDSDERFEY